MSGALEEVQYARGSGHGDAATRRHDPASRAGARGREAALLRLLPGAPRSATRTSGARPAPGVHDQLAKARMAPTPDEVMSLTLELVAHDLRSPLSSSRQAVGQLLAASANGDHRLLTVLAEALDSIGEMVDDLLGLEASPDATGMSRIDVDELMRTCVAACSCPERIDVLTVPAQVEGNLGLLKASIGNVIENALRHGSTEVLLRAGPVDSGTLIMVDDDGPGIPEELRELVFRPRVRLAPDDGQGAGLGLALVRRTVEFHGGSAWVEAAPSGGARFCIWLP